MLCSVTELDPSLFKEARLAVHHPSSCWQTFDCCADLFMTIVICTIVTRLLLMQTTSQSHEQLGPLLLLLLQTMLVVFLNITCTTILHSICYCKMYSHDYKKVH